MTDDDDKNFDKNLKRIMIGGAILANTLIIAGAYDAGYQSASRQAKSTITVQGNLTINNNSNNQNSSQPTSLAK
jgi:hypothetical protein